jgi:hypothetical protein
MFFLKNYIAKFSTSSIFKKIGKDNFKQKQKKIKKKRKKKKKSILENKKHVKKKGNKSTKQICGESYTAWGKHYSNPRCYFLKNYETQFSTSSI